jgi:tRNA (guanine-N7-)-methyltransferase
MEVQETIEDSVRPSFEKAAETKTIDYVTSKRSGYVSRAHRNPLAIGGFRVPLSPRQVPWSQFYPKVEHPQVRVVDVGSGYGGLLFYLATRTPPSCCLFGLEIRTAVWRQAEEKLLAQRWASEAYQRVAFLHTNAQRYLWNYIEQGSLDILIFAYPDPHFKRKKHRQRIISRTLLPLYAYLLRRGGRLYASTDVEALYEWMYDRLEECPLFTRRCRLVERSGQSRFNPQGLTRPDDCEESDSVSSAFFEHDPYAAAVRDWTDEGQRVSRMHGDKFLLVYERR